MAESETRSGIPYRTVFLGLVVSLGLALALAFYVYERYVRYVPRAMQHVPSDFAVALRLDVEQAVVYEPFRQHFLPLLEANRPAIPAGGRKDVSRLDALRDATTIELGVDLRELGIVVDQAGRWLVLLGGHFRQDGVVRGVASLLVREGVGVRTLEAPERLIHTSGVAFGAAPDGVLVLAQTEELLLRSLVAGERRLELGPGTAVSLAFGGADSGLLSRARLEVFPGQAFETRLTLPEAPSGLQAGDVAALLSGNTGDFRLIRASQGWSLQPSGSGSQRATTVLSRAEFDALVANVASGLALLIGLDRAPEGPR